MKRLGLMVLLAAIATSVYARGVPETPMEQDEQEMTIVDIAVNDDRFDTLVTALGAADLVDTLSGDGPFTVFAPTDEAFEALPAGTLESLLAAGAKDKLTSVLTYHVVSGS